MEIGHLKQQLYPRAVSASVEGSLRKDNFAPDQPQQAATTQARQRPVPQSAAQHTVMTQPRFSAQEPAYIEPKADHAQAMLAASLGEKLLLSRQTRNAPQRGYTPEALLSTTGKRAHISYHQADRIMSARYVDEMV